MGLPDDYAKQTRYIRRLAACGEARKGPPMTRPDDEGDDDFVPVMLDPFNPESSTKPDDFFAQLKECAYRLTKEHEQQVRDWFDTARRSVYVEEAAPNHSPGWYRTEVPNENGWARLTPLGGPPTLKLSRPRPKLRVVK